jgi:hypothetical protein
VALAERSRARVFFDRKYSKISGDIDHSTAAVCFG